MAWEGVAIKCISGDGAGELGRSVKFQRMLADRGIRWRSSPPRTPQSNGIAERENEQQMRIARIQLVRVGRGEDYWFFTVADAASKVVGRPHEYIGGGTPCERLIEKPFNYDRLRMWGAECFVHQNEKQRGACSKLHPYAKSWIMIGHDRLSPCWYVCLMQETKIVKSSHITFESEAKILNIVGELNAVELSDDENEPSEEEGTAQVDGYDGSGGQPTQDPTSSKRSSQDSGFRKSSRLAQRRRAKSTQHFRSSDDSISCDGNFLATLLENEDDDTFCMMGLTGEIGIEAGEPTTMKEALSAPDVDEGRQAMEGENCTVFGRREFSKMENPRRT